MRRRNHIRKDLFDRLMELPVLNIFEPFYIKYKSVLLYLFFGVLTTVVSIAVFALCTVTWSMNVLAGNVISWICAVTFAYVTNRTWVFDGVKAENYSKEHSIKSKVFQEMLKFYTGRLVTLAVEEAMLLVMVQWMKLPGMGVKIVAQFVVIVLNYVISKLYVFRTK